MCYVEHDEQQYRSTGTMRVTLYMQQYRSTGTVRVALNMTSSKQYKPTGPVRGSISLKRPAPAENPIVTR